MRAPTPTRADERRLVVVLALLIAGVLASAATALAGAAHTPDGPGVVFGGFDVVRPTPVRLAFAKPQPPRLPIAAVTAPQAARPRPADRSPDPSRLCSGAGWQQRRGEAALAGLRHGTAMNATIDFLPGRGALRGMTFYDRHHVDVYVGSCDRESDALLRHVVAHELGHAWDSLHMTAALRADYLAARGIPAGTPWFGCDRCQDFATPAGDYAETYAQWQRGSADSRSQLAPPASPAELERLAAAFFTA